MSKGLWLVREALEGLGELLLIAPERPQSATSMSLTFHKPLRVDKVTIDGCDAYSVSGSPADCVSIGVKKILEGEKPDIVISGINEGDNTSAQVLFASGTVAAAIQGAIEDIPAVAFSIALDPDNPSFVSELLESSAVISEIVREIVHWVIENRLPSGADLLNVNFPSRLGMHTPIVATKLAKRKFSNFVVERLDPRNKPYYWQSGDLIHENLDKDTDVYQVLANRAVSITPITLDLSVKIDESLPLLIERLSQLKGKQ